MPESTYYIKYSVAALFDRYHINDKRKTHILSTAHEMVRFADRFSLDTEQAYIAGVFHDIARDMPHETIIDLSKRFGHLQNELESENPKLLHAYASAQIIIEENITSDSEIIQAVASHTTGAAEINTLGILLYVLDFAEPLRSYPEAAVAYQKLQDNLYEAAFYVVTETWNMLIEKRRPIHHSSIDFYNYLVFLLKNIR